MSKIREVYQLLPLYKESLQKKEWTREFFEELKNNITYHSNKIEGLSLSYGETIQYLKFGLVNHKTDEVGLKDITSLNNHRTLLDYIFDQYQSLEISTKSIKSIHKELLHDPLQNNFNISNTPGEYKEDINGVFRKGADGKRVYHEFLAPAYVSFEMEKLVSSTNKLLKELDFEDSQKNPIAVAAYFHYKFSNIIHPFHDGNGRIARLYTNLILMKNGFPPVIIKGESKDRENYISSIIDSLEDALDPLIELIATQLIETM